MPRLPIELRAIVRRRRLGRWAFYGILTALLAAIFSEHLGCFGWQGSDHSRFDQKSFIIEAITRRGTLLLAADPARVEVKLLGLNEQTIQPQACAVYLGRNVVIRLESLQTRDVHGRLLAYLYLDERTVLNVELLRQGAAKTDRSIPHSLQAVLDGAESDAKRRRRGIWK